MNLAGRLGRAGRCCAACGCMAALFCVAGCLGGPTPSSAEELRAFEKAGPLRPEVDLARLVTAKLPAGPYRVVAGDVLELSMPAVMRVAAEELPERVEAYLCRVSEAGTIPLPVVGDLKAAGKTLSEIESATVAAYHPKYVVSRPAVVARVAEYRTTPVSVIGAVEEPGIYHLRSDEMSLVAALMKAGNILRDQYGTRGGAGAIHIHRPGKAGKTERLILPVKGLNVPFADVALKGGEIIEVERLEPRVFTVVGLVNKPVTQPYPPGARYNLLQALGFAGGMDATADPRYVKVYRQKADGEVIAGVFRIDGKNVAETSKVLLKPGDLVVVDNTPRTRARTALAQAFRMSTGFVVGATYNINPSSE